MRILIIDSDDAVSQLLKKNLEAHAFAVDISPDGEKGSYMARVNDYDIVIMDNFIKEKSSMEVCRDIRNANKLTPIIITSAKATIPEKVSILREGADDHLTKPFFFEELLARIEALLRRPPIKHDPVFSIEDVKMNCSEQLVTRGEKRIYLTRKEFALLEYLLRNKGAVVSRSMIMEHVWDNDTDPFSNTIESHILNLRKKIDNKKKLIHNVPGRGYKIDILK